MWLDVRGYRKCLFDFVDEVTAHDLYNFYPQKLELRMQGGR